MTMFEMLWYTASSGRQRCWQHKSTCLAQTCSTFQSPARALLRDRDLDLDLGDLERDLGDLDRDAGAALSRLVLLSRVRLTDQIRCLVSMMSSKLLQLCAATLVCLSASEQEWTVCLRPCIADLVSRRKADGCVHV